MIDVKLVVERDLTQRSDGARAWIDTTTVKVFDDGDVGPSDEYTEFTHTTREQVLLDFLTTLGYNVQLEEVLVTEE